VVDVAAEAPLQLLKIIHLDAKQASIRAFGLPKLT